MTPPTKKHSLPNQKRGGSLLFFLSVIIATLPTKTNAQCPNDCDPCIGRNVNYIQCPTTDCAQFVQCTDGKTSQTFNCAAGLMFDAGTSSCGWVDPTIQGKLYVYMICGQVFVFHEVCWGEGRRKGAPL